MKITETTCTYCGQRTVIVKRDEQVLDWTDVSIEDIEKIIVDYLSVSEIDLYRKDRSFKGSRKWELVRARGICYKVLRDYKRMSLTAIAARFNRTHASIINGLRTIENENKTNFEERSIYNTIINLLIDYASGNPYAKMTRTELINIIETLKEMNNEIQNRKRSTTYC